MVPNSVPTVIDPELKYHHLSYKQGTPGDDANNGSQGRIDRPRFSLTPSGTAFLDLAALVIGRRITRALESPGTENGRSILSPVTVRSKVTWMTSLPCSTRLAIWVCFTPNHLPVV